MARSPRLDQQLCFSIYAAEHAFTRFYRPLLAPLGLTYPQYLVLLALWEADNLTVSDLGERLFLDSGTLTPLLKRMEQSGFIHRARDARDERRRVISLTPRGHAIEQQAASFPMALGTALDCSAEDMAMLRTLLARLRQSLAAPAAA